MFILVPKLCYNYIEYRKQLVKKAAVGIVDSDVG